MFHGRSSAESEARFYKSTARFSLVVYPTVRLQMRELFQQSAISRLVFPFLPIAPSNVAQNGTNFSHYR